MEDLNNTLDQQDITDTHIRLQQTAEYTFLSSAQKTLCMIDHILTHKTSLNKREKIEIKVCSLIIIK